VLPGVIFFFVCAVSLCFSTVANVGDHVEKGEEMGYFAFGGSTILLLFKRGSIRFDEDLVRNSSARIETLIKMGESIGQHLGSEQLNRSQSTQNLINQFQSDQPIQQTVNPLETVNLEMENEKTNQPNQTDVEAKPNQPRQGSDLNSLSHDVQSGSNGQANLPHSLISLSNINPSSDPCSSRLLNGDNKVAFPSIVSTPTSIESCHSISNGTDGGGGGSQVGTGTGSVSVSQSVSGPVFGFCDEEDEDAAALSRERLVRCRIRSAGPDGLDQIHQSHADHDPDDNVDEPREEEEEEEEEEDDEESSEEELLSADGHRFRAAVARAGGIGSGTGAGTGTIGRGSIGSTIRNLARAAVLSLVPGPKDPSLSSSTSHSTSHSPSSSSIQSNSFGFGYGLGLGVGLNLGRSREKEKQRESDSEEGSPIGSTKPSAMNGTQPPRIGSTLQAVMMENDNLV